MAWKVEKAEQTGGVAVITVKHVKADGSDDVDQAGNLVTRTLRHERSSFKKTGLQTLPEWQANMRREVWAMIAQWDTEEAAAVPTDITAEVR